MGHECRLYLIKYHLFITIIQSGNGGQLFHKKQILLHLLPTGLRNSHRQHLFRTGSTNTSMQYLIPHENSHIYYVLSSFNLAICLLGVLSWLQAIRIPTQLPPGVPSPRTKTQLRHNHPLYTHDMKCEKEGDRYKPPRTSHCSKDGCTVRFVSSMLLRITTVPGPTIAWATGTTRPICC